MEEIVRTSLRIPKDLADRITEYRYVIAPQEYGRCSQNQTIINLLDRILTLLEGQKKK